MYDFKSIETKWQKKWENDDRLKAVDFHPTKPKFYVLYEFFNISGNLHMGHLKGTVPADALARYKRLNGYNVLFPIGGDAFGLPAENAAIKYGIEPHKFVENGMKAVLEQSKKLGLSFDWSRTFATSDPSYYKWTQWIFLQLLKHGKAYKEKGTVNFCPKCQTVLSNEDSQGGKCDRCGSDVEQVSRDVWFLKMREYADKLLGNVQRINMPEHLKESQRYWIGKTEGIELGMNLVDQNGKYLQKLNIYTTCIETVYGVTFVVLAPENKLVQELKHNILNYNEVQEYVKKTTYRTEFDRISQLKDKTGCVLEGIYAINPVTGAKVPVFIADFVLAGSGTGAVMAVPCHDQRDYEFAQKFNIPFVQVIEGDCSKKAVEKAEYLQNNSKMLNSEQFNGMPVRDAKVAIGNMVIEKGYGKKQVNFKMKDWAFNRQRYWGEPFPVVFCNNCGIVPLSESYLPLTLPKTNDYIPNANGDSPLSKISSFVNCKCPKCGNPAQRETDTMPNWAGSSWYWLRYTDPHNNNALADYNKLKYWGSVDVYTGGTEHITRHVLYAFFWQNFLYDIGVVPTRDPFVRKLGSGLILDDEGKKMSKSSKNGVSPLEVIDKYGADVARLHVHFLAGYEDNCAWTYKGIEGIVNFLDKVWALADIVKGEGVSREHEVELNALIKKCGEDYENLKLNTAISACMIFLKKVRADGFITKEELRQFLIVLNPMAPHITSEMYENMFGDILDASWPKFDESKTQRQEINLPVQVNGKMKGTVLVDKNLPQEQIEKIVLDSGKVVGDVKKVIYVPGRIINFIV